MSLFKGLAPRIAWRYLWKKKSYGAVSAIAAVSVTGVAVATAAILCVLSVFNGFRGLLSSSSSRILPDIEVTPTSGKTIADAEALADSIAALRGVEVATPAIEDQALVIFGGQEMPVILRGIDPISFRKVTSIDSLIIAGEPLPADAGDYEIPLGLISIGVGQRLKSYEPGEEPLFLFAPRREGRINPANPMASFFTDSVSVAGVFRSDQQEFDATSIYVPIEVARGLFQYDSEATSIKIKVKPGEDPSVVSTEISRLLNADSHPKREEGGVESDNAKFQVRDRARLEEVSFRMVEIEKWVTTLLLFFILIIASFNIISTMTMFVLEKRRSLSTLRALGMRGVRVGAIFAWESLYVTLLGGVAGIILGISITLLQQNYGLITIDSGASDPIPYPVRLIWGDLWIVGAAILIIGIFTSAIAASFARSRISEKRQ